MANVNILIQIFNLNKESVFLILQPLNWLVEELLNRSIAKFK